MNKNDEMNFAAVMASLQVAFNREVTKDQISLYFNFLNDLSIQQIERAVEWIIRAQARFPFDAWSEVLKLGGKYSTMPKFKDPIIEKVINKAFGGWENFGWYKQPNEFVLSQDRKHFILAYKLFHHEVERRRLLIAKKPRELEGVS